MRVVPYQPRHLMALDARDYERRLFAMTPDLDRQGQALAVPGLSVTVLDGPVPIACGGILPLHRGVGEAWYALSRRFAVDRPTRDWASLARLSFDFVSRAFEGGFHRLQAHVPADFPPGHRWARRMGFEAEGTMRGFGPDGSDFVRFARILKTRGVAP